MYYSHMTRGGGATHFPGMHNTVCVKSVKSLGKDSPTIQSMKADGVCADDDMDKAKYVEQLLLPIHRCHHCLSLLNTERLELSKENPENLPPLSGSPENMHTEHPKLPEGSPEKLLCTEDEVMYLLQTIRRCLESKWCPSLQVVQSINLDRMFSNDVEAVKYCAYSQKW